MDESVGINTPPACGRGCIPPLAHNQPPTPPVPRATKRRTAEPANREDFARPLRIPAPDWISTNNSSKAFDSVLTCDVCAVSRGSPRHAWVSGSPKGFISPSLYTFAPNPAWDRQGAPGEGGVLSTPLMRTHPTEWPVGSDPHARTTVVAVKIHALLNAARSRTAF